MNTNEQQAQRDKLIELAIKWSDAQFEVGKAVAYYEESATEVYEKELTEFENAERDAEKAFRDYVEHMHDEVPNEIE